MRVPNGPVLQFARKVSPKCQWLRESIFWTETIQGQECHFYQLNIYSFQSRQASENHRRQGQESRRATFTRSKCKDSSCGLCGLIHGPYALLPTYSSWRQGKAMEEGFQGSSKGKTWWASEPSDIYWRWKSCGFAAFFLGSGVFNFVIYTVVI